MNACHIEYIEIGYDLVERRFLRVRDIFFLDIFLLDKSGKFQFFGRNENEFYALIAGHRADKRMNRSSEFKVAAKPYFKIVKATFLAADREKIGQGLRRVIMSAVSRIYDGNRAVPRRNDRRALLRMPHRDYIGIAADNFQSVGDAFAFCGGT